MPHPKFDRSRLLIKSLKERKNQISFPDKQIPLTFRPDNLKDQDKKLIQKTARKIIIARQEKRPVILAFGAHAIKNGLGQVLIELIRKDWVTHLATNEAGIIHDWEFAFQGKSGEDVRENVKNGQFGIWEETGFLLIWQLLPGLLKDLVTGNQSGK